MLLVFLCALFRLYHVDDVVAYLLALCYEVVVERAEPVAVLAGVDGLEVFSTDNGTQAGVLSVRHKSINVETLCEKLGAKQIAARCGLHCAPFAHQTVGTINTGTLRFSFSPFITKNQVKQASSVLKNIIIYEKLINR